MINKPNNGFKHIPVLEQEVIEGLKVRADGIYVDGTLGGGGHASSICERLSETGGLIGIDRDQDALTAAEEKLRKYNCRKIFNRGNYANIKTILRSDDVEGIDGCLLDLGVSSYQLDEVSRGFSYMNDAPLDMRMDSNQSLTAEEIVNSYSKEKLTEIIKKYGEERWAKRISDFIVTARAEKDITSTGELTTIIKAAIPASARRDGPHPAKRTFQAIRIEVNNELAPLEKAIDDIIDVLNFGGRLAIISFHSLEDRIVKEAFKRREDPCTCPKDLPVCICGKEGDVKKITRKPITASEEELENNPRARSAKLRILEKI